MNFKKTFEVTAGPNDAKQRVCACLKALGYEKTSETELRFKRGSMLGSLTSFSPRKWEAKALILIKKIDDNRSSLYITLDVNTTGQKVTQREMDYWNTEIDHMEVAMQSGDLDFSGPAKDHQNLISSGWKGLRAFSVVAMAVIIPCTVIASLIRPGAVSLGLGSIGLMVGLSAGSAAAWKHWGAR